MSTLISFKTPDFLRDSIICRSITVEQGQRGFIPGSTSISIICEDNSVIESLVEASMFGWHTPAAKLANTWIENNI